jgi:hypothetical protein
MTLLPHSFRPLKNVKFLSFISTGKNYVLHWCSHADMQTNNHQSICYTQENCSHSLWYIEENNNHCLGPPPWLRVVLLRPVLRLIFYLYPSQQLSLELFYILSRHYFVIIFHHSGIPPISCQGNFWILMIQSNFAIRNFLVALKLFLNTKSSLSLWSKWHIGHRKWFLNTNLFLIKPFRIAKFDCKTNTYYINLE